MKYFALIAILGSCGVDEFDDDDLVDTSQEVSSHAVFAGINGSECIASKFNCRFHDGDSRVLTPGGSDRWAVDPGASVRDGNGTVLATESATAMTFNFGQTRALAGKAHALALTTSNASAGWYPFDHIVAEQAFRDAVGNVDAKDPHEGHMACYEVRDSVDPTLVLKKVVYNSKEPATGHERAGDYLPLVRANGRRSVNLIFSVPGFGLGGATTDHFPAGTKFRRVTVPTTSGHPSISIPLWVKDSAGAYKRRSGTMRFVYGFVRDADGVERFGWMAEDALEASSGC